MSQSMLLTLVGTGIVLLGGIVVIFWLTGRTTAHAWLRSLLRIVAIPIFALLVVLFGLTMARAGRVFGHGVATRLRGDGRETTGGGGGGKGIGR